MTACCAHCNTHKSVLSLRVFMQRATDESDAGGPSAAVAQQILKRGVQRETRLARYERCTRIADRWRALLDATRHVPSQAAALFYLRHMQPL